MHWFLFYQWIELSELKEIKNKKMRNHKNSNRCIYSNSLILKFDNVMVLSNAKNMYQML